MLILTRRIGETLMVGDDVTVTVLGVKGNQVRIGVNAPKEVAVHREEIYQRILKEKSGGGGGSGTGTPRTPGQGGEAGRSQDQEESADTQQQAPDRRDED